MFDAISYYLKPIKTQINQLVARGVVKLVDDNLPLQVLQVSLNEDNAVKDDVERIQQFGFTSHPPLDESEALILSLFGVKLAVAVDNRKARLKGLKEGEVAMYNGDGSRVTLKEKGKIEIHNGKNELISVLKEMIEAIENATIQYPPPNGTLPPTQFKQYAPGLIAVKQKIASFLE